MNPIIIHKIRPGASGNQSIGRLALLAAGVFILALSAVSCATTRGFGHDVEHTGDAIQEAASH